MVKAQSKKEKKSKGKSKAAAAAAPGARAVVVASVAAFLEASGFPRALAALQSEANLEAGAWRSTAVSLDELVAKFLESSSAASPTVTVAGNEQAEDAGKKKKDGAIELNGTVNDVSAPSAVQEEDETGDKKKKKKKSKGGADASEPESKAVEPSTEEKPTENAGAGTKEKKHKKKKDKDGASAGEATETVKSDDQKVDGKKKKKSKKQEEDDDDIEARLEKASLAIEKKKKEKKLGSEASEKIDAGNAAAEADGKSGAVETGKDDNKDKKSKKKLKKSGSEESDQVDGKGAEENGSVPKTDNLNKNGTEVEEGENGKPSSDNAVVGKKRKLEDVKGSNAPATENGTANQNLSNGFAEDDSKENGTASKPSKRQKKSAEPKSVTPFQRVKLDAVKFADERLQDNSYWAKGGAEIGYGAKAQEVLGQVRGRGFRHEKTKKKRGTYRGGQIDLGTHSIKFNDSDDEE